jgi:hypothetical protein
VKFEVRWGEPGIIHDGPMLANMPRYHRNAKQPNECTKGDEDVCCSHVRLPLNSERPAGLRTAGQFVNFTWGVCSGAKHTNANSSKAMVRCDPLYAPCLPESQTHKLASGAGLRAVD